ncbi:MAG: hypothetical protein R6W77_10640 [Trueperaceae bacterium]
MIASDGIRSLRERLAPYGNQVVSLYLDVNPASPDNVRKAWSLRARAALEALNLPKEASRRIAERLRLEVGMPDARTLVVFTHAQDESLYESLEIDESLAPVDAAGGALARWGKPFLAPLELTTMRRRPSVALVLGKERIRRFLVHRSAVDELPAAIQPRDETAWREMSEGSVGMPGVVARGGSGKDIYERRTADWESRFRKVVAAGLAELLEEHDAVRVVLMGREPDVAAFEGELDDAMRPRVGARIPLPPDPDAPAPALADALLEAVARAEEAEADGLLDHARERGVWGSDTTLRAVDEGRVRMLIVPDVPYQPVFRCAGSGRVLASREAASAACPGEQIDEVPLADTLPELASRHGLEIAFARGAADERLTSTCEGLAGLLRW